MKELVRGFLEIDQTEDKIKFLSDRVEAYANQGITKRLELEGQVKELKERINYVYKEHLDLVNSYGRLNDLVEWLHTWVNCHGDHTKKKGGKPSARSSRKRKN